MGRPLVATADVHYLRKEDYHHHAALLCVQTKSTLAAPKMSFDTNEFYLKSSEEMAESFSDMPEALASTVEIAERCETTVALGQQLIPRFDTPNGESEEAYLRTLVDEGLRKRYGDPIPAQARERADMELAVIGNMGFNAYFLIVHDFVAYAKSTRRRRRAGPRTRSRPPTGGTTCANSIDRAPGTSRNEASECQSRLPRELRRRWSSRERSWLLASRLEMSASSACLRRRTTRWLRGGSTGPKSWPRPRRRSSSSD